MTDSDEGDTTKDLQGQRTSTSKTNSDSNSEQVSVLLGKYRQLLSELDHFQSLLKQKLRNPQVVEVRQLRSNLVSEMRALEKLQKQLEEESGVSSDVSKLISGSGLGSASGSRRADENGVEEDEEGESAGEEQKKELHDQKKNTNASQIGSTQRLAHALRSSNLPFYEAVWTITKTSCTGLVSFWKRFYWESASGSGGGNNRVAAHTEKKTERRNIVSALASDGPGKRSRKDKRKSVMVDIVADDGEEWVKVSTISESRLLFEMAKKGWEADSEEEGSSSDEVEGTRTVKRPTRTVLRNYDRGSGTTDSEDDDDDDDEIELIKLAADMRKAANATRVRYKHPRIRFVIPKIEEGKVLEIDHVLKEIRSHGITVECGSSAPGALLLAKPAIDGNLPIAANVQELDLSHLLPRPFKRFTATLNVDCTLLLALVSDLSHFKEIPPSPNRHIAILRQMEIEKQQPLLPAELWPAMIGHDLVCTQEAERRMREIVGVIGTDAEKQRTAMLLGDPPYRDLGRHALLDAYQQSSDYTIPSEWRIPIRTVDAKADIETAWVQGKLPPQARQVAQVLSEINHSVFFWGWVTGTMTITSNRTVVRQIETEIEKNRGGNDLLEGPLVWVCDTARSLVGKDKDRKS